MALLAAPHSQAFCIEKEHEDALHTANSVVLDALRKIRKIESASGDTVRLRQLDEQIQALQEKGK